MAKRCLERRNNAGDLEGPHLSAKSKQPLDAAGGDPRERVVMNVVFAR